MEASRGNPVPAGTFSWIAWAVTALLLAAVASAAYLGEPNGIKVFKTGGNIDLDLAPHGATLTTMGGNIHLRSVGGAARLKTMGGDIEVDSASDSLSAVTMSGNVTVRITQGAENRKPRNVEIRSNAGQISLYIPPDFGATVDATVAYTDNQHEAFSIIQDLGLRQTMSSRWDYSQGTPRKYIHATGQIGDGRNHIALNTINGNITLRSR